MPNKAQLQKDMKLIAESNRQTLASLETLVNHTIIAVEFLPLRECQFVLHLSDGRSVTFSASGDDSYATFEVTARTDI